MSEGSQEKKEYTILQHPLSLLNWLVSLHGQQLGQNNEAL